MIKVRLFVTFGGKIIAGDVEDEDAPMLKLEFCNELAGIPEEDKFAAGRAALKALGFEVQE